MVRMVAREMSNSSGSFSRLPDGSRMPADSMAMSDPPPMATAQSATASAGVSLMPSPTMQTVFPCARRRSMAAAFSSGRTSESTWSMPTSAAMASAVRA